VSALCFSIRRISFSAPDDVRRQRAEELKWHKNDRNIFLVIVTNVNLKGDLK